MKKVFILSFFLLILGCKTATVIEKSNEKADIELALNNSFEIKLESNPSTGYSWHWANESSSSNVKFVKSRFVSKTPAGLVGGGGYEIFTFVGQKKGVEELEFIYIRSWEKGAPPAKRVLYKVGIN